MRQIDQDFFDAIRNGQTEVVQLLLNAGADVHTADDYALWYASKEGYAEVVQLLLNAGVDVHAGKDIAIRWASHYGYKEVVQLLLAYYHENSLTIPMGIENV